jgi:hypothetical protein
MRMKHTRQRMRARQRSAMHTGVHAFALSISIGKKPPTWVFFRLPRRVDAN